MGRSVGRRSLGAGSLAVGLNGGADLLEELSDLRSCLDVHLVGGSELWNVLGVEGLLSQLSLEGSGSDELPDIWFFLRLRVLWLVHWLIDVGILGSWLLWR